MSGLLRDLPWPLGKEVTEAEEISQFDWWTQETVIEEEEAPLEIGSVG